MYSRNKLFMVMVGLVILLISVVSTAVSCGYAPLSIELDSPDDGAVTKTNLVKASGIVSKPGAVVKIDGKEATVSGDGSFYAYLDLAEGENTI